MTPLELTYHQARTERLGRFKAAADALMQRQVKQLTDKFDAQAAADKINAEKLEKLNKAFAKCEPLRPQRICREVRHKHGFTWKEMINESQADKLCAARCETWARLRSETRLSFPQIGRLFKRHHATVWHGVEVWNAMQKGQGAKQ